MKKSLLVALVAMFVVSPLFAGGRKSQKAQRACYQKVQEYLASSAQFSSVLRSLDTFSDSKRVKVTTCELEVELLPERRYVRAPDGPEPRSRVSADVTLTVQDLVNGHPLGGMSETLHMDGTEYVDYSDTALPPYLEVEAVNYAKSGLRELRR